MRLYGKRLTQIIDAIGGLDQWAKNCHACSLAIVRTGLLPIGTRVARGFHPKVGSQHSWVVIGNPYNRKSIILDGTLWSYTNEEPKLLVGRHPDMKHTPHGYGSIWQFGRPPYPIKEVIKLPRLSKEAEDFLKLAAPKGLDMRGWMALANSPVLDWPAAEIIGAMYDNAALRPLIPVDIVGMLTDKNPGNLYF